MAGAVTAIEAVGGEAVPLVHAWALPSGPVEEEAYGRLRRLLEERLADAGRLDGVVLSLHGAMATGARHDPDAELIEAARAVVGDQVPIAVTLDLHANVTPRMVEAADVKERFEFRLVRHDGDYSDLVDQMLADGTGGYDPRPLEVAQMAQPVSFTEPVSPGFRYARTAQVSSARIGSGKL